MRPRRRALVIGMARSGAACARVLDAEGWSVLVVDAADTERVRAEAARLPAGVEVRLGGYEESIVDAADMVCPSPAVRWDAPLLERARAAGIAVRSEIALAFERCSAPIAGVTGTNGKTTTTALLGALLAACGRRVHVGGNIGETILDRLASVEPDDWVVLELSSFQLETVDDPRCRLATVLNLSADHLDRHGTMARYTALKRRLVEHCAADGCVALNAGDAAVRAMAGAASAPVRWFGRGALPGDGATVRADTIVCLAGGATVEVMPAGDVPLFGEHNIDNVLAAIALAEVAGAPADGMAEAVRGFRAVAHRLEPIVERRGVLWVDDSKATNVDAAVTALRAFDRPIVWIGGGQTKGVGPEALAVEVALRARHAVLNGATAAELDAALAAAGYSDRTVVPDLRSAVEAAHRIARPGDVVLLSPGYTSFDQFRSFEERGEIFSSLARSIADT